MHVSSVKMAAAWIAGAIRDRRYFASLWESLRTVPLRFAVTGLGRRWLAAKDVELRMAGLATPVRLRRGTYDIYAALEILVWGEYRAAAEWLLPPDATIVDLGGNIGLASLYFSTLCPHARFLIVEPDADNLRVLAVNCRALIESGRMDVVRGFAAAADGRASIDRSRGSLGYRIGAAGQGESVAQWSVAALVADRPRIDLLKCDVEGAERDVFRDCRSWIGRVEHLIVETHPPYSPDALFADLRANGWEFDVLRQLQTTDEHGARSTCFLERRQR